MSLSRRKFLNTSLQALLGMAVTPIGVQALFRVPDGPPPLEQNLHHVSTQETRLTPVAITQDREIEAAVTAALEHLPVEALVRGRLVAVKPNETSAKPGATGAVTQPDTLRAVLRYLKQYAPRHLVVSGGSGAAKTDEVFRAAGLMKVVEEEGVEFFDHNRPPFVSVELPYAPEKEVAGPQHSVLVNPRVLEYETVVALNQLKVHATATVTLALKNIAMSYPPADYYGYPRARRAHEHHFIDDLHSFIASMAKRFPIQLAITVGHPAMIGNGPLNGHVVETGLVIASTDALAADVVGAYLLGFNIQAVRHLWEAERLSVGESRIDRMTFPAMSLKEAVGAFTQVAYGERLHF
ncbi:DUF362 domain-containing protein [Candidatus Nitrospira bockiana]